MSNANFHLMSLNELASWIHKNNNSMFDTGEFPSIDNLNDDEEDEVRQEYEAIAEDLLVLLANEAATK